MYFDDFIQKGKPILFNVAIADSFGAGSYGGGGTENIYLNASFRKLLLSDIYLSGQVLQTTNNNPVSDYECYHDLVVSLSDQTGYGNVNPTNFDFNIQMMTNHNTVKVSPNIVINNDHTLYLVLNWHFKTVSTPAAGSYSGRGDIIIVGYGY